MKCLFAKGLAFGKHHRFLSAPLPIMIRTYQGTTQTCDPFIKLFVWTICALIGACQNSRTNPELIAGNAADFDIQEEMY